MNILRWENRRCTWRNLQRRQNLSSLRKKIYRARASIITYWDPCDPCSFMEKWTADNLNISSPALERTHWKISFMLHWPLLSFLIGKSNNQWILPLKDFVHSESLSGDRVFKIWVGRKSGYFNLEVIFSHSQSLEHPLLGTANMKDLLSLNKLHHSTVKLLLAFMLPCQWWYNTQLRQWHEDIFENLMLIFWCQSVFRAIAA